MKKMAWVRPSKSFEQIKREWVFQKYMLITYVCLTMFMGALLIQISYYQEYPSLTLFKGRVPGEMYDAKQGQITYGKYFRSPNSIYVTLADKDIKGAMTAEDKLDVIYHEYGHFIYYKKMSKAERQTWTTKFTNSSSSGLEEFYDTDEFPEESFARSFSGYLVDEMYHYRPAYQRQIDIDRYNFITKMYLKYID